MEKDIKPSQEHLSTQQELLNHIYKSFLDLPATDVDVEVDNSSMGNPNPVQTIFKYDFAKGTTTPGYTDTLKGKFNTQTGEAVISYAKGIFEGRITLKRNPETQNVDLIASRSYQKDSLTKRGGYSMLLILRKTGEHARPHLRAVVSLIDQFKREAEENPELFKSQIKGDKEKEAKEKLIYKGANAVALARITRKQALKERAANLNEKIGKKRNGNKKISRR